MIERYSNPMGTYLCVRSKNVHGPSLITFYCPAIVKCTSNLIFRNQILYIVFFFCLKWNVYTIPFKLNMFIFVIVTIIKKKICIPGNNRPRFIFGPFVLVDSGQFKTSEFLCFKWYSLFKTFSGQIDTNENICFTRWYRRKRGNRHFTH